MVVEVARINDLHPGAIQHEGQVVRAIQADMGPPIAFIKNMAVLHRPPGGPPAAQRLIGKTEPRGVVGRQDQPAVAGQALPDLA
jgi:hypothetical protein